MKRIAYICASSDQDALGTYVDEFEEKYGIKITWMDTLPKNAGEFAGMLLFGMSRDTNNMPYKGVETLAKTLPCVWVYTLIKPNIPGVITVDCSCKFNKLMGILLREFKIK